MVNLCHSFVIVTYSPCTLPELPNQICVGSAKLSFFNQIEKVYSFPIVVVTGFSILPLFVPSKVNLDAVCVPSGEVVKLSVTTALLKAFQVLKSSLCENKLVLLGSKSRCPLVSLVKSILGVSVCISCTVIFVIED